MIRVCDAIMGTGKSSAAITYMNEHPEEKYIYITPYLDEAARIKSSCAELNFIEPSNRLEKYQFRKSIHTAALIEQGENIATTHQAFRGYTQSTLEMVKAQGYILIVDENVEVLEQCQVHPDDIRVAARAGLIEENNGAYHATCEEYNGVAFRDIINAMRSRELIQIDEDRSKFFYWALPPELITSFKEVFVLTYLFEGQSLHHLFEIYNIPYSFIGIQKDGDGTFRFGDFPGYTPEYVHHLKEKIHILDNQKLNDIGEEYYAMSKNWFERGGDSIDKLKANVYNCFNNIWRDIPSDKRLWGSYNDAFNKMRGKGYTKSFLTFNAKATNAYKERSSLVYIANVFMNANEKTFYTMHGVDVDQDMYALSIMVQWIWRSAIREGNEVQIYIPSKRMRTLLEDWIESFEEGGDANV